MKFLKISKIFKVFADLKFALVILFFIAITSSIGSIIEQDQPLNFYQINYSLDKPIYGFLNWKVILFFGLNNVYSTWWFSLLLFILGLSLIICSITRQFPILKNSKEYFFKKQQKSFLQLPFSVKIKNTYFLKENILMYFRKMKFYTYQYGNLVYGFKGLIGRISPILVHLSLITILTGTFWGAFNNFKAQEILPKGEIFHVQNLIKIGNTTEIPEITARVNDFWVEYKNDRIYQFYSDLSLLNSSGNELKHQTISVNNPLRYKSLDFYQSDWNLLGVRLQDKTTNTIYEIPLFQLKNANKSWVTWVTSNNEKIETIVLDQLQNKFTLYDDAGAFLKNSILGDDITSNLKLIDIIPATGLQIKYDPSIPIIYLGFGLLMITALLSFLPYTQIWLFEDETNTWIGSNTNRGKISLEIEFENLIRLIEKKVAKTIFSNNFKS